MDIEASSCKEKHYCRALFNLSSKQQVSFNNYVQIGSASPPWGMSLQVSTPTAGSRCFSAEPTRRTSCDGRGTSVSGSSTGAVPTFEAPRRTPTTSRAPNHRHEFDELLWARTQAVAASEVNFDTLTELSLDKWPLHVDGRNRDSHEGFRIFSRQVNIPDVPRTTEVLATGELQCSLAETAALLRCPDEESFNTSMSRMYGRSFQQGSIVHTFASFKNAAPDTFSTPNFLAAHRCVKTASFGSPALTLFGHSQNWCFLEEFATDSQNGFTLSQRSLRPASLPRVVRPPIELLRRRHGIGFTRSRKQVHHLVGFSLGYSVETIPNRQPAAVRLVFYGCSSDEDSDNPGIAQQRMLLLARGLLNLPDIIRRHRISAQVPADRWSISKLLNTHTASPRCVSCSRTLHRLFLVKKTPCYLCAHYVCSRCWVRQPLEASNGRGIAVLVCPHCLRSVQNCNYAHLVASSLSCRASATSLSTSSRVSIPAAEVFFRTAQVLPDADEAEEPGHAVISCLEEILSGQDNAETTSQQNSSENSNPRIKTAANVLQQLVSVLDEGVNRVMTYSSFDGTTNPSFATEPEPETSSALQTLRMQFAREVLPLAACVLSNAVTRAYPIDTTNEGSMQAVLRGPIPPNEAHRLEAITQDNYLSARGSNELNLICKLASREMSCGASLVTIVGNTLQYILASDSPIFRGADIPREHTLCQHLLMGDRPIVVQHPEADVRFSHLSLVVDHSLQFYAGFPIFSRDGYSVVGSLCCIDTSPQEMTQSEYSTLLQLTRTASRIIEFKSHQARSLQRLRRR